MIKLKILFLVLALIMLSCSSVVIVDKPIIFDKEREQLSLEYLKNRYGLIQETPTIEPKMIVVHWTAIPSLTESFDAFKDSKLPNWRPDIANASALNVSAQFLIDQDGTIYRLLPETTMARHVIGLNYIAIGIENVGGTKNTPLTKKQLKANIELIKLLKERYPDIEYVIGHFEYTNFEGHELWLEKDNDYRTEKTDPGVDFINTIRKKTSKYNWKPVPQKKE
jgi:N-acetylmuramoyl-L-alanine amidase